MRGRNTVDPELARVVEQRLERLLAEQGPRRAVDDGTIAPDQLGDDPRPLAPDEVDDEWADPAGPGRRDRSTSSTAGPLVDPGTRSGFSRVHLGIIGALVVIGVLLGGWAVLRAKPVPLPAAVAVPRIDPADPSAAGSTSALPSESGAAPRGSTAASPPASPTAVLVVHVLGAVRRPGLVELSAGARVQDAIEAAGGLKSAARLGKLNLAQALSDGQQVVVGQSSSRSELRGGTASSGAPGSSGSAGDSAGDPSGAPLDLNAASAAQLETLPGVGPVTAAKIITWRENHGRFARIEELQEVAGIGPKTYAEIAPHVRV